jgi:hypothetical protein
VKGPAAVAGTQLDAEVPKVSAVKGPAAVAGTQLDAAAKIGAHGRVRRV